MDTVGDQYSACYTVHLSIEDWGREPKHKKLGYFIQAFREALQEELQLKEK